MKNLLVLWFLIFSLSFNFQGAAQESLEKPSFENLWTHPENKKARVIQVFSDSICIYNSDLGKASTQYRKTYPRHSDGSKNTLSDFGRVIFTLDSGGATYYKAIDFCNLGLDSVSIFDDFGTLNKNISSDRAVTYYSTTYLNYQKIASNAKDLTKEEYIGILKTVLDELKNPDQQKIASGIQGKTTEEKVLNFLKQRVRKAPYERKVFPETLAKASSKFKSDETVKKTVALYKPFFSSKGPEVKTKGGDAKTSEKKTTGKSTTGKKE
jgi:hypothetical protein